jgi:hypothetical protein
LFCCGVWGVAAGLGCGGGFADDLLVSRAGDSLHKSSD